MFSWLKLTFLASVLLLVGCVGGVKEETTNVIQITPVDRIKAVVQSVADSGAELGSGEESLKEAIEELRATDSTKASAIDPDFEKLVTARDAATRKSAAKSLVSKL